MTAYYAIVALGLCLVMGYAGQISMGHAAFFAIGGYTSAVLTTLNIKGAATADWGQTLQRIGVLITRQDMYGEQLIGISPWLAFLIALLLTFLIALLVGYPSLRLKGHYLAMATLGFGLIIYRLVLGSDFTGASDGINGVPPWQLFPGVLVSGKRAFRVTNYYVAWSLAILVLVFLLNLVRSRIGRALKAIHGDEMAANAMGVNSAAYKLRVFVLSAMLAAMAGCFLTHYNGGIGPSEASAMKSVRYVALVAVGGMANLWGVLLVSAGLNYLSLRGFFGSYDDAFFGLVLIIVISLAPDGPLKPIAKGFKRFFKRYVFRSSVRKAS